MKKVHVGYGLEATSFSQRKLRGKRTRGKDGRGSEFWDANSSR
jgi:hypothetical protein